MTAVVRSKPVGRLRKWLARSDQHGRLPVAVLVWVCTAMSVGGLATSAAAPIDGLKPGTVLGEVARGTSIAGYDRWLVWSAYDVEAQRYRLVVFEQGRGSRELPITSKSSLDADIGPDASGKPTLVYSRCVDSAGEDPDCDVYRYNISSGRERIVRGASSVGGLEYSPRIWRDRVAFFRETRSRKGVPFVARNTQLRIVRDGQRHSTLVPGTRYPAFPAANVSLTALDIRGSQIIYSATDSFGGDCPLGDDPSGGPASFDTWIVDLGTGRQRSISRDCYAPSLGALALGPLGLTAAVQTAAQSGTLTDVTITKIGLRSLRRAPLVLFSERYGTHRCALNTSAQFSGGVAVVVSSEPQCRDLAASAAFTIEAYPGR